MKITQKTSGKRTGSSDQIREWLKSHADGGYSDEIAKDLGLETNNVSALLRQFEQRQEVVACDVERDGCRRRHYRASALLGIPRPGKAWKTFTLAGTPSPRRDTISVVSREDYTPAQSGADELSPAPLPDGSSWPENVGVPAALVRENQAEPRFALYSDGTLILERLPNLPEIIAIRPEHSRQLVAYLKGESHA